MLAGLECTRRASEPLRALAATLAAPTLTTYKAKGVFDEHDALCLGAAGLSPRADAALLPLVRAADVVLLAGYDPVEMRASYVEPFGADTRVLELTACARTHQMHRSEAIAVGDLTQNIELLCARLCEAPPPCFHAPWRERAMTVRSALQAQPRRGFGPLAVTDVLSRVVPAEPPITLDTARTASCSARPFARAGQANCCRATACAPWATRWGRVPPITSRWPGPSGPRRSRPRRQQSRARAVARALARSDAFAVISCAPERGAYEGLI